jgi:hypothetical protein
MSKRDVYVRAFYSMEMLESERVASGKKHLFGISQRKRLFGDLSVGRR